MKLKVKKYFTKELILFYLILILGSILRLQGFFTNSFAFTYDVGRDLIAVSEIASLSKISLIGPTTGIQGVFYGPWWYLFLTPFFILFQGDPRGIEFTMFLAGFATMVIGFFLGKKTSGPFLGTCLTLLIAVSPFLIFTSSQIWNPNVAPLVTILAVFICCNILFNKKPHLFNFLLIGLVLGLSIDVEIVYGTFLTIGILIGLAILSRKKFNVKTIGLLILGFLIIFSPRILFEVHHNFLMTNSLVTFLKSNGEMSQTLLQVIVNRLDNFWSEFAFNAGGNLKYISLAIILFVLVSIITRYKKASENEKQIIKLSSTVILTFFIGMLFFKHFLYPHYFAGIGIFFIILVGVSIILIEKRFKKMWLGVVLLLIISFVNFNPVSYISDLRKPLFVGDASVYRNQLQVIDYVYSQAKGKDFKYVVYTPPIFDYTYRYLFSWYGPRIYGYSPVADAKLAFFIMEPDNQLPQRLTDWLKIREKDGKIVKIEKLPSGIIVQTRTNK